MKTTLPKLKWLLTTVLLAIAGVLLARNWPPPASPPAENGIWMAHSPAAPAAKSSPALEAEFLAAKADAVSLQQRLEAAKHAIEEALQMVQEQRDNFDFAEERYHRLMPLVEKGTLDLMTASQIQSAYIAARASLSQAKFYLGQAQREYGTPETRTILLQAAGGKVEAIRQRMGVAGGSPQGGMIVAEFPAALAQTLAPGASVKVIGKSGEFSAVVRQANGGLVLLDAPGAPAGLPALARCQVVIPAQ
ncbi:MAG TPA: hypothetical protein VIS74_07280 [Chthoniobacterales bacterium]